MKEQIISLKTPSDQSTFDLWTVTEVSNYLRLMPGTVRTMARKKILPGFKIDRDWRFRREDIENWVAIRMNEAKETPNHE
jgi:excisionase family DNA binding protein